MTRSLAVGLCIGLLLLPYAGKHEPPVQTVRTANGMVSGIRSHTPGVEVFEGVPYAAAPVGYLRWRAPEPHANWSGVLTADHFGGNCMQATQEQQANPASANRKSVWTIPFLIPQDPITEDCLYLNVWTGASSSSGRRPVIVWIHGGGFQSGSGSVPLYDGSAMAKKGVVFVTINYRLGVFGFLALRELSGESSHHASGDYGLLDQIAALQWVRRNIAAFGGDPENVTIAGQSAGSFSVNYLVASPLAKGLFQRAIGESGASMLSDVMYHTADLSTAEAAGRQFMEKAQVASLEALRQIPADSLMKIGGSFSPIIDGYVLPEQVSEIFEQGKQNDVPTLTGWNVDEGTAFSIFSKPMNAETFRQQAQRIYGNEADQFLRYYPAATDEDALSSQFASIRDLLFAAQNYVWANLQTKTGTANVYLYSFDRTLPANDELAFFGAFHSGEIAYVLDNLDRLNRPWQPVDRKLADTMASYWVNFARSGNPNGEGLARWPVYQPGQSTDMELGETIGPEAVPHKAGLDFLIRHFEGETAGLHRPH
jgi:para-nitrobenzyl esterase